MKLIKITWYDAHGYGGEWRGHKKIDPEMKVCKTVGYIAKETKNYICVVQTDDGEGSHFNHMCVPRTMVKNIKKLK